MIRSAILSPCGLYRYSLRRQWGANERNIMGGLLLNPSKADSERDDPTSRRFCGFARREGYDGFLLMNLYALVETFPAIMRLHPGRVGPETDSYLARMANECPMIVAAWGVNAEPRRVGEVLRVMRNQGARLHCFGLTKDGHPRHPVRLRNDTPIVPFEVAA